MELLSAYIPMDRRQAMVKGEDLPDHSHGAALFADVSGFTALTEVLARELGPKGGAEELSQQLNLVFDALITEVHQYRGSVISFSGDAITCWLDRDDGLRATACALAMQTVMQPFADIRTPAGQTVTLAMKVAVATGPVRRFRVGNPNIQLIDVLAGATLDRMAATEKHANKGEVVLSRETLAQLHDRVEVAEWRREDERDPDTEIGFAVVARLNDPVETAPWPALTSPAGPISAWADPLDETQVRPWLLPPVYERLKTGQSQFLAEIRPAVALFLRFGGIDYDQDEAAGTKLDAYMQWVQSILHRYEAYPLQLTIGDKGSYLYSAFGAPLAHDDDSLRAVAAALELRSPPHEMDFIRGVQIGLSRGRMWAGAYGGSTRRTYGVLGDEVNTAARLMAKAEPGQVLVSPVVAHEVAQNYHLRSIGPITIKGKQAPLPVSIVLERRSPSAQRPVVRSTAPLVGRENELKRMEELLDAVLAGEGQILRLEGVAGLGKSHLAAEFVERASRRGVKTAIGACQSTDQDIAYSPWRQLFRTLFALTNEPFAGEDSAALTARQIARVEAMVHQANPGWLVRLPLLGDLLGLPIPDNATTTAFDPRLRQEALFALVVNLIQTWAQAQPLLLLMEDVHWLDEASLGLTLALSRVITRTPILLLLVQRPPLQDDQPLLPELNRLPYHHQLNLSELSADGIAALVTLRLQGSPSALALSFIQAQAQGNPFFTEELVDNLREAGSLHHREDGTWILSEAIFNALRDANCLIRSGEATGEQWTLAPTAQLSAVNLGIPDSIHGIVLSRIDRLPETHKLTLKVASVIGRVFEFDLLARVHPAQLDEALLMEQVNMLETRDFARLEMPRPRLAYMFKHNITQEVAYETLLEAQQRELHQSVGEALENLQPDAIEQLAYHYSRGRVRRKMVFYLDQAARKAQREYANETALSYYSQALSLGERWEWRKGQVEVLHVLGRRDEEQAALRALDVAAAAPAFEVGYLWGQFYEVVGDYAQAQAAIERALAACQQRADVAGEVRCLAQLGLIARRRGDYDSAKSWYLQALGFDGGSATVATKATYSDEEAQALVQALNGLGIVYRQQGNFDEAKRLYEQALSLSRKGGNRKDEAEVLNSLGVTAYYQRNFTEALSYHQQALEIRHAIGDRTGEGTSFYNLALAVQETGDYAQAEKHYSKALITQQATGSRWEEINIWNVMGILYHQLGDLPRAQNCLQQGLELSREIGDEAGQAYILANLGLVARDRRDLTTAEKLLIDGLSLAQTQNDKYLVSYFLSHLGAVSLRAGRLDPAVEQAGAALTMRREIGLQLWTTADLTTLAAASLAARNADRALDYARQALAILDECGGEGPEFPQQDYFICYQVLSALGQAEIARTALQSAYQLVMARAEKITDPNLRQSFLERVPINREIVRAVKEDLSL